MATPEAFARRVREQKLREKEERERARGLQRRPMFSPAQRHSYQMRRRFQQSERQQREAAVRALRAPGQTDDGSRRLSDSSKSSLGSRGSASPARDPEHGGPENRNSSGGSGGGGISGVFRRVSRRLSRRPSEALRMAAALVGAFKQGQSQADEQQSDELALDAPFDVVVVGGGFAGAYCAYRLRQDNPALRIAIMDRRSSTGGRTLSAARDEHTSSDSSNRTSESSTRTSASTSNSGGADDLAPMRVFPDAEPAVAALVREMGCHMVPERQTEPENLFFVDGARGRRSKFLLPSGRSCADMLAHCTEHFRSAAPDDAALPPLLSHELRNLSLPAFLRKYGASAAEVEAFFAFSGAEPDEDAAASAFFAAGDLDADAGASTVREGFAELVRRLAQASGAHLLLGCCAVALRPADDDEDDGGDNMDAAEERGDGERARGAAPLLRVDFRRCSEALSGRGSRVSGRSRGSGVAGAAESALTRRVVLALPQDALVRVARRSSSLVAKERLLLASHAVKPVPVFVCALVWPSQSRTQSHSQHEAAQEEAWWRALGLRGGKSTTDLEIRQVRYGDGGDALQVTSTGRFAEYWDREFRADWRAAAREVLEQIKALHGEDAEAAPEPDWSSTAFRFCKDGAHAWRTGVDVPAAMRSVCRGGAASEQRVCVVGDAFSSSQGRAGGAVEMVELALPALVDMVDM